MNHSLQKQREQTFRLVAMGIFAALAYTTTLLPHIKVAFLTVDIKDAVIAIAAFLFGPSAGYGIALVVSLLEMITVSDTGPWGALMNFAASAAFACIAAIVYKRRKDVKGAVIGLSVGSVGMISTMMVMNLIITPLYFPGMTTIDVVKLIPTLLLPFNIVKTLLNMALTLLLYKPVSLALKRAHLVIAVNGFKDQSGEGIGTGKGARQSTPAAVGRWNLKNSVETILIAVLTLTVAAVVYFFLLRGYEMTWQ